MFVEEFEKEIRPYGSSLASMITFIDELVPMTVVASPRESSTINSSST